MSTPVPRAPFRWVGSKSWCVKRILELAPDGITEYVEPFLGSGCVFYAMASRGRLTDAMNRVRLYDANPNVAGVHYAILDEPVQADLRLHRFYRDLLEMPMDERKDFVNQVRDRYKFPPNVIRRVYGDEAAAWNFLIATSYMSLCRFDEEGRFKRSIDVSFEKHRPIPDYRTLSFLLETTGARITTARVQEMDFSVQNSSAFTFCDPPYLGTDKSIYGRANTNLGFTPDDMSDMVKRLHRSGGRVMVTHKDTEQFRDMFNGLEGWQFISIGGRADRLNAAKGEKLNTRHEVAAVNYEPENKP